MQDQIETLLQELNEVEAMNHITWLTENTPKRISGMGDDKKAAEYVCEKMSTYGLDATLLEFEAYNSWPEYSNLQVLLPETIQVDSLPCCHIASTLPEGVEGDLIYVGAGGIEDYAGQDPRGKIVLVEVSYAPATPEKARIAADKGAIGMICMNWGADEPVICNRALKSVWGNPTTDNFKHIPQITGLSVTRKAGTYLRDLCNKGTVRVLLKAEATRQWDKLVQPMGWLRGSGESNEFLLVTGHLDAWEPGVTCNATGNGTMLELARVLAKHGGLKRDICFVFWNGHEIAEAAGSAWFADNYWDMLRDNCIVYKNIDSTGMKGASHYKIDASRELSQFAETVAKEILKETVTVNYLEKTGDQSFFGIGIPSIAGRMSFSDDYVARTHGATLGWWNHTIEDTLDKVDLKNLKKDLLVDLAYIYRIANSDVLPYNFNITIKDIKSKLEYIDNESNGLVELKSVIEKSELLINESDRINQLKTKIKSNDQVALMNATLKKLSRILTSPFYTYTDRYHQDSYGLTVLSKPIPLLFPAIEMAKMDRSSLEFKLAINDLVKNRNRISDALSDALSCVSCI
jgi:hypothetical protein